MIYINNKETFSLYGLMGHRFRGSSVHPSVCHSLCPTTPTGTLNIGGGEARDTGACLGGGIKVG
jgi:hypothetical protein